MENIPQVLPGVICCCCYYTSPAWLRAQRQVCEMTLCCSILSC